jgi:hypothetical protein
LNRIQDKILEKFTKEETYVCSSHIDEKYRKKTLATLLANALEQVDKNEGMKPHILKHGGNDVDSYFGL